jgi:uncharacterized protein (DUF927 family)
MSFDMRDDGLYSFQESSDDDKEGKWVRVSDPFQIIANLCDESGHSYSVAASWTDNRGRAKRLVIPLANFGGQKNHLIVSSFLEAGLAIELYMHAPFIEFLWHEQKHAAQMELAMRTGWHLGERVFILPDATIGDPSGPVIYDPPADATNYFAVAGTLDGWRSSVSQICEGNSRLVFSVSLAFAPPLIALIGADSIGAHLRGGSSLGKTTCQHVAGSVWGGGGKHGYLQSWRSTINGLEGIARGHNDALLALDEMSECDPRNVVNAVYLLMNGKSKNRAGVKGNSTPGSNWAIALLSSGEVGLAEHAEKKSKGGAEVRLLNIEADAGRGMGLFETVRGRQGTDKMSAPQVFAMELNAATRVNYGHAARAFLTQLSDLDPAIRVEIIRDLQNEFRNTLNLTGAVPEVQRVANSFALIAAAGELATIWGITGWPDGEADKQVKKCFECWLEHHGGKMAVHDEERVIEGFRQTLEQYGESRFTPATGGSQNNHVSERFGWRRTADGTTEYLFSRENFKTVSHRHGLNYKAAAKALDKRGYLRRQGRDFTIKTNIGRENMRVYCVLGKILTDD